MATYTATVNNDVLDTDPVTTQQDYGSYSIGSSALIPPNVASGYNAISDKIKEEPSGVTATYNSPFTTNAETGALEGAPAIAKGETFMTPETTVAGQVEKLIKSDSPLMKLGETKAKEQASALGMSSSSMAIGAAQKALYESALPIAEADAKTAAGFKQLEQQSLNKQAEIETESQVAGQLVLQKAQLQEQSDRIKAGWEATVKGLDEQTKIAMTGFQGEINAKQQELTMNLQSQLNQQQINADVQKTIMNQSQDMLNNYQITIQQLLGNQAFLDSMPNAAAMNKVFNNLFDTVSSSIKFSAKSAGAYASNPQMSTYVNDLVAANLWT